MDQFLPKWTPYTRRSALEFSTLVCSNTHNTLQVLQRTALSPAPPKVVPVTEDPYEPTTAPILVTLLYLNIESSYLVGDITITCTNIHYFCDHRGLFIWADMLTVEMMRVMIMVLNATFNKKRYGLKFYIVIPLSVYKYDLCMILN